MLKLPWWRMGFIPRRLCPNTGTSGAPSIARKGGFWVYVPMSRTSLKLGGMEPAKAFRIGGFCGQSITMISFYQEGIENHSGHLSSISLSRGRRRGGRARPLSSSRSSHGFTTSQSNSQLVLGGSLPLYTVSTWIHFVAEIELFEIESGIPPYIQNK